MTAKAAVTRLTEAYPRLVPVHLPVHASWLNQVEIYFSILERKVLTPAAAASLEELAARILAFQVRYEALAQPFQCLHDMRHGAASLLVAAGAHPRVA